MEAEPSYKEGHSMCLKELYPWWEGLRKQLVLRWGSFPGAQPGGRPRANSTVPALAITYHSLPEGGSHQAACGPFPIVLQQCL